MSETKTLKTNQWTIPDGEAVPIVKGSHVYLIDGSGYIFRAFHALPPLTRPSDGLPVGAVHGFCAMLWKLLRRDRKRRRRRRISPSSSMLGRETFRNEIYHDYKAQPAAAARGARPAVPADPRRAVKAFNVACIEQEGYEADDLIATYARAGRRSRRRRDHRLVRQGPDAARRAGRRHARHHEEQEDRAATR